MLGFHGLTPILVLTLWIIGRNMVSAQYCPDILPCNCYAINSLIFIICDRVPMSVVKYIFNTMNSPITMNQLDLYIQLSGDSIPEDLLGQSIVAGGLRLYGPSDDNSSYPLLQVDLNAFTSSSDTLQSVLVQKIDTNLLDFEFLVEFSNVSTFQFLNTSNLQKSVPTIPVDLPTLSQLYFGYSAGLNEVFQTGNIQPLKGSNLTRLWVTDCQLNENGLANLLNWVLPSSIQTLWYLTLDNNNLEYIPQEMSLLKAMRSISLKLNNADLTISNNSVFMPGYDTYTELLLSSSRITSIESGAFQGNYGSTKVELSDNFLTRFEEGVFKSMLEDMLVGGGSLDVGGNPFDCYSDKCHLAWLLRDNRQLLDFVKRGQCDDGLFFENLDPSLFDECPENLTF